jgi:hypothetical protein
MNTRSASPGSRHRIPDTARSPLARATTYLFVVHERASGQAVFSTGTRAAVAPCCLALHHLDAFGRQASETNDGGLASQVRFLVETFGAAHEP